MQIPTRPFTGLLLAASAALAGAAEGELIELAWPKDGRFTRELRVPPGRFVEACGRLPAATKVQWRFEAGAPLDFNVHYHAGKDVHYPARKDATARADGTFEAPVAQDYCWMWTNRASAESTLRFTLQKR